MSAFYYLPFNITPKLVTLYDDGLKSSRVEDSSLQRPDLAYSKYVFIYGHGITSDTVIYSHT
eukprot:5939223-Ditylum_brightwellii.AAC.1